MDGLIAAVGEERFRDAQEWAWATAAGTGRSLRSSGDDEWPAGIVDVPHDLSDLIWDKSEEPWLARLELAFELYRQMPCYATLMYMPHKEWDDEAKGRFWDEYRSLLSDDDDRLADPVAYSLWCDYFEDPDTVEEAWLALASPGSVSDRGLERMLEVSGPVPYAFKVPLYERLVASARWHPFIFRSLLFSAFDVYGRVDAKAAQELLKRLSLPKMTENLDELMQKLDAFASAASPPRKKKRERRDRRAPRRA